MKKVNLNKKKVIGCFVLLSTLITFIIVSTRSVITNIDLPVNLISISSNDSQSKEYSRIPFYKEELLERYHAYQIIAPDLSLEDIVTHVNMGIDKDFFENDPIQVSDPGALDVLVNKFYKLPEGWEPANLVLVNPNREQYLNERAAKAFYTFQEACKKQGFNITVYSGYRSIEYQNELYNRMLAINGEEQTNKYIARPGHSEHATGLSIDISIDGIYYEDIENSPHYQWFRDNLSDYGFILRYPEDKEHLTGYHYESWHIRYLGTDLAKKVEASGLTYDEYVARQ